MEKNQLQRKMDYVQFYATNSYNHASNKMYKCKNALNIPQQENISEHSNLI